MKLQKARLKDVLSHEDAEVSFGDVLTVFTGSSDSGKSGVMRGLDQALRNRPAGIDLLRHAAKRGACSEMTVTADDEGKPFSVTRRRGKSKNEYEVDGQPLLAFGQDVPVEVASRLRLSAHAFQLQSDGNFMLCETDGQVAKMLSGTVGLAQIDAAFTEVRKRKTANDTALACAEADEKREKDALERFCGLGAAEDAVTAAEALAREFEALRALSDGADVLASRFAAVPRGTKAELDATDAILGEAFNLWEMWRDETIEADDANETLQKIEALPEDVSRRIRSARAALLGAGVAEDKAGEANDLAVATNAFLSRVGYVPYPTNTAPAYNAMSEYAVAKDGADNAKCLAVQIETDLCKVERLPMAADASLQGAKDALADCVRLDNALAAVEATCTWVDHILHELDSLAAQCEVYEAEMASWRREIDLYKEQNKVCPECGAEQEHWAKGE